MISSFNSKIWFVCIVHCVCVISLYVYSCTCIAFLYIYFTYLFHIYFLNNQLWNCLSYVCLLLLLIKLLAISIYGRMLLILTVRKRHGKKKPPLRTVDEGLYWVVALGQNSRGRVSEETKGVCEGWGVGRGFIARAGVQARSSHIRKKAQATAAGGVQGLRVGICLVQAAGGRSPEV